MDQLIEINSLEEYEKAIQTKSIILFTASWCPDCMFIKPFIGNVVKKYPDDYFVIANKKYSEQIYNQLMELGVSKNKVIKCTALPSGVVLLELCVRYSTTESH